MTKKFDWIKDDPCYGCKHAVRLPDEQVNGIFGRRFACKSVNRRNGLLTRACKILEQGWDMLSVKKAYDLLSSIVSADREFLEKRHYPCSDDIAPQCKELEEENNNTEASADNGTYTKRKIDRTDGIWETELNKSRVKSPTHCMRGKSCKDGCEFYDRGFCRGIVYPTYPPQYKRCDFENNGNAGQQYFTDKEINGFRGETNDPNRTETNWKTK